VSLQTRMDGRTSKEAVTVAMTPHQDAGAGVMSGGATGAAAGNLPWKPLLKIRDVSLSAEVIGHGYPLLLMHGAPSVDHFPLLPFRQLADRLTLVLYDHRCTGHSADVPVSSMTWENLTADAEALRQELGFDQWAMLGHSFGGMVALEYALRYPASLSHLVLLDAGGDSWWPQQNAAALLARRGYSPKKAEAWIFAGRELWKGRTVMDRLGEISVPTLVMAGRDDVFFPPEHQGQLAAGIPAHACRSSSGLGTSRTPSGPLRSLRPSGTSSAWTRRSWP
jgi:pimeloyl-ACP methyl ester carboxylesterase